MNEAAHKDVFKSLKRLKLALGKAVSASCSGSLAALKAPCTLMEATCFCQNDVIIFFVFFFISYFVLENLGGTEFEKKRKEKKQS